MQTVRLRQTMELQILIRFSLMAVGKYVLGRLQVEILNLMVAIDLDSSGELMMQQVVLRLEHRFILPMQRLAMPK